MAARFAIVSVFVTKVLPDLHQNVRETFRKTSMCWQFKMSSACSAEREIFAPGEWCAAHPLTRDCWSGLTELTFAVWSHKSTVVSFEMLHESSFELLLLRSVYH